MAMSMSRSSSSSSGAKAVVGAAKAQFITNKMCPFAQKAWIALETSNIPFTLEEISLYGAGGKPSWFLKLNPAGTVPVLNIKTSNGQIVLPDSELILDYVAKNNSDNGNDDLKVKSWRESISQKVIPIGKRAVLNGGANTKEALYQLLDELEQDVDIQGPYLCGNEVTVADCCAFPFLWRIDQEFGIKDGKIKDWLNVCQNEEAFQKTIQNAWWWWW
jgi:glutathione S-transferase